MTRAVSKLIFYSLCCSLFGFTLWNDWRLYATIPYLSKNAFPRYVYLTHITIYLQIIYYGMATLGSFGSRKWTHRADTMRAMLFPLTCVVVSTFWAVFSYDRSLIYQRKLDDFIPAFQNHLWHTAPMIAQIFDCIVFEHAIPSKVKQLGMIVVGFGVYLTGSYLVFLNHGVWAYGFMTQIWKLGHRYFIAMVSMIFVLACGFAVCGNILYHISSRLTGRKRSKIA